MAGTDIDDAASISRETSLEPKLRKACNVRGSMPRFAAVITDFLRLLVLICAVSLTAPGVVNAAITTSTTLSLVTTNAVTGDVALAFRVSGCAANGAPFESGTIQIFEGTTSVYTF